MVKLPHLRERRLSERLAIEAISRDFGDPNLFLTLNNSPRETYDTHLLLRTLETGFSVHFDPNAYEYYCVTVRVVFLKLMTLNNKNDL